MDASEYLKKAHEAYRSQAWADVYSSLSLADQATPLRVADLELLATSAFLTGHDDHFRSTLERAHHAYLDARREASASRSAFWIGLNLLLNGEKGPATGWFTRAQRLIEERDCVEKGYLLLPRAELHLLGADHEAAYDLASDAVTIGERFRDIDLVVGARHLQGRALILKGQVQAGLTLLDEAMVAVIGGELSPIMTGLIYCSVIEACQQAYALGRAREWTEALSQWCERQPQMYAFTATCLVRRSEIMRMHGDWLDAVLEARRARERPKPPAAAFYQEGEVHRLRGDFSAAENAYKSASTRGHEPQPGLSLLRLAQGRKDAAYVAIRRVASASSDPLQRANVLPAYVEIMLATDNIEEAQKASAEMEDIAAGYGTTVLRAMAKHARGAVQLAEGDAESALISLRTAHDMWRQEEAPYLAARVRVLIGQACLAMGDKEGGTLEFDAARSVFGDLGAAPDIALVDALSNLKTSVSSHGLTPRQLQVLRLVAAGKTNKAIAAELFLSEKTIDRHVSNILNKLDVPSRAAATAYAYEHDLV